MRLTNLLLTILSVGCGPLCAVLLLGPGSAAAAQPPALEGTIVAAGDSLTAGYGVPESEAYPALLEKKLRQSGYRWKVINAGISGETSSGLLSRVDWILKLKPDLVILETGANDGMRGVDPKLTHANIEKAVSRLQEKGVTVLLVGMRMFANLGKSFTAEFANNYSSVAKKHHLVLMPFFLEGVAGDPSLNQSDGIHPVGKGYRIVTDHLFPYVVKAIDQRKKQVQR